MNDDHIGAVAVTSVVWMFILVVSLCLQSDVWRTQAINHGVGGYNKQTGDFEWIVPTKPEVDAE